MFLKTVQSGGREGLYQYINPEQQSDSVTLDGLTVGKKYFVGFHGVSQLTTGVFLLQILR